MRTEVVLVRPELLRHGQLVVEGGGGGGEGRGDLQWTMGRLRMKATIIILRTRAIIRRPLGMLDPNILSEDSGYRFLYCRISCFLRSWGRPGLPTLHPSV